MKKNIPTINQLPIDELQDVGKHMFALANGNYLLQYTEEDYEEFLLNNPHLIPESLMIYFISSNWGYDDARMFEDYDVQWLAEKVDSSFNSTLDFTLTDFAYENLRPYQQVVIDFTKILIEKKEFNDLFGNSSLLERVYFVLANNLDVENETGKVKNKRHAISRAEEMIKTIQDPNYLPEPKFQSWELKIY